MRLVWQHEGQRLDDVRRLTQHDLALGERFAHEAEFELLEIAQSAVDQLRAPLRRRGCKVVAVDDQHLEAATRGIARDARAVDAAADDDEVVLWGGG